MASSEENPKKIQDKLAELNKPYKTNRPWIALEGYSALTDFKFGDGKEPHFNPGRGYPVKVFVNTADGEVKIFSAYEFRD